MHICGLVVYLLRPPGCPRYIHACAPKRQIGGSGLSATRWFSTWGSLHPAPRPSLGGGITCTPLLAVPASASFYDLAGELIVTDIFSQVSQDVPKRQIGGSGLSTSLGPQGISSPCSVPSIVGWLDSYVLSLFEAILGTLFLSLLRALWFAMPGRRTPLGSLLGLPTVGASPQLLRCLGSCGRPSSAVLDWSPGEAVHKRSARQRSQMPGRCVLARCLAVLLGFSSLPVQVWAAPPSFSDTADDMTSLARCSPETLPQVDAATRQPHGGASDPAPTREPSTAEGAGLGVDFPVHVLIPGHRSVFFLVRGAVLDGGDSAMQAVRAQMPTLPIRGAVHVVPVQPQVSTTAATVLALPTWVQQSYRRGVVLDFSAFGGPTFAVYVWEQVTLKDLTEYADVQAAKHWEVYVALAPAPVSATFRVNNGDMLRFVPRGSVLASRPTLPELFLRGAPTGRDQTVSFLEQQSGEWLVFCEDYALTVPHNADPSRLRQDAAAAMRRRRTQVRFSDPLPIAFVQDYVHHGRTVAGAFATAVPDLYDPTNVPQGAFVFLDGRQVGRDLRFLLAEVGPCPVRSLFGHLQLRVPAGFRPCLLSEPHADDVELAEGKTLTVALLPENQVPTPQCCPGVARGVADASSHAVSTSPTVPQAPRILGVGPGRLTTSSDDEVSPTDVAKARFLVLRYECTPDEVEIVFRTPMSVPAVLAEVAAALPDAVFSHYPLVAEVAPQPSSQWGLVLALPGWARDEPIVVFDAMRVDGRVFAASIGLVSSRQRLCAIAGLDPGSVDVYAYGSAYPLAVDADLRLEVHRCIFFVPHGDPPAVGHALSTMVMHPYGWASGIAILPTIEGRQSSHYCLATAEGERLHHMFANTEEQVLPELVHSLGWPAARTHVQGGRPRVTDACLRGFACRNVLAVARFPDDEEFFGDQFPELALVDCRPLLQGWHLLLVYGRRVPHAALVSQLAHFVPAGHQVLIEGARFEGADLLVGAGQVLVAQFVRCPVEPEGEESESGSSDAIASNGSRTGSPGQDTTTAPADSEGEHLFEDDPRFCPPASRSRSRSRGAEQGMHEAPPDRWGTAPTRSSSSSIAVVGAAAVCGLPGAQANFLTCADATGQVCVPWQLWCCVVLFGVLASFLLLKWLAEPASCRPSEQFALASLRLLARRAGQHWRYVPGPTAIDFLADSGSESGEDYDTAERDLQFVILTPGYPIIPATVRQALPAAQEEVIQQVQDLRGPFFQSFFPRLLPADPQTVDGLGVLVADVGWTVAGCVLCVDATRLDRRLFAVRSPEYVCREELLDLTNVGTNLGVEVFFGGDAQPLAAHVVHRVRSGLTIILAPADSPLPPTITLGQNLLSPTAWRSRDGPPFETMGHVYCLATAHGSVLLVCNPSSARTFTQQIADCLAQETDQVAHFPASPRVVDATCDGLLCRTAMAVCQPPPSPGTHWFGVLIDARALLQGWRSVIAFRGRLACSVIFEPLQASCPTGWQLHIQDVPTDQDQIAVHAGQVLRVVPIPHVPGPARTRVVVMPGGPSGPPAPTPAGQRQGRLTAATPFGNAAARAGGEAEPNSVRNRQGGDPRAAAAEVGGGLSPGFTDGTYVIVGQDYCPELVHVRLPTSVPVLDALRHINAAREPGARLCLPRLIAAHPQSVPGVGVLVAAPAWEPTGALVLLDCTRVNGGLFVLQLPSRLQRQAILDAAGLGSGPELEVYLKDLPWPLPQGASVDVTHGDVVVVVPVVHGLFTTSSFPDLLSDNTGWDPEWAPDQPYGDHAWVLAESDCFVFQVVPGRREFVRVDIAHRLAISHLDLALRPARPAITNYARRGVLTRNLLAAVYAPRTDNVASTRHPVCFIDSRPLLLGVTWRSAPGGLLARHRIQDPIQHRCPPGFVLCWFRPQTRPSLLETDLWVQDGEVIVLVFLPVEVLATDLDPDEQGGTPPGPPGNGRPTQRNEGYDHRPRDGTPATSGPAGAQASPGTVATGDRAPSGIDRGLLYTPGFLVTFALGSRVAKWARVFLWFTSVLLHGRGGSSCLRSHPCSYDWKGGQPSDIVWHRKKGYVPGSLLRLFVGGLCIASMPCGAAAVSVDGPPPGAAITAVKAPDTPGAYTEGPRSKQVPLSRPIPTPCRREAYYGLLPSREPSQGTALQHPTFGPTEALAYVTLLEEAIRKPGSRALFLAATLLETLYEWEQERDASHGVVSVATLEPRVQISLQHTVPLTQFQASVLALSETVPGRETADLVDWLDADISFLLRDRCVPPHKRDLFAAIRNWAIGPADVLPVRLLVYSDGSAPSGREADCAPGAWAISVWVETASCTYLLGHAAGLTQPPESMQHIGEAGDTALTCELLGVSWGLAWVIEHAIPFAVPVVSYYDCLAAGRGAFGENKVSVSHHSASPELGRHPSRPHSCPCRRSCRGGRQRAL